MDEMQTTYRRTSRSSNRPADRAESIRCELSRFAVRGRKLITVVYREVNNCGQVSNWSETYFRFEVDLHTTGSTAMQTTMTNSEIHQKRYQRALICDAGEYRTFETNRNGLSNVTRRVGMQWPLQFWVAKHTQTICMGSMLMPMPVVAAECKLSAILIATFMS